MDGVATFLIGVAIVLIIVSGAFLRCCAISEAGQCVVTDEKVRFFFLVRVL